PSRAATLVACAAQWLVLPGPRLQWRVRAGFAPASLFTCPTAGTQARGGVAERWVRTRAEWPERPRCGDNRGKQRPSTDHAGVDVLDRHLARLERRRRLTRMLLAWSPGAAVSIAVAATVVMVIRLAVP